MVVKDTYNIIAQRKTVRGIEGCTSDEADRVARHKEEGATAEATRNSEEARAGAELTNSEDRVTTGAAVAGTDNAAEARELAMTEAKLTEARRRAFSASVQVRSANTENVNAKEIEWILDSGCTDHVINDENYFSKAIVLKEPINVKVGDGRILKATKVGYVNSKFKTFNDNVTYIEMKDVFYVKDVDKNLISFAKVTDKYKVVSIGDSSKIYNDDNKLIAIAWKNNRVHKMTSSIERVRSSLRRSIFKK